MTLSQRSMQYFLSNFDPLFLSYHDHFSEVMKDHPLKSLKGFHDPRLKVKVKGQCNILNFLQNKNMNTN